MERSRLIKHYEQKMTEQNLNRTFLKKVNYPLSQTIKIDDIQIRIHYFNPG